MKKTLLALALTGAFSGAAFAQSSVTIYGIVDTSFTSIDNGGSGNGKDRVNGISSGQNSASRIGFKGIEDLGNGLKAEFVLEQGINTDDGTSTAGFNRLSFIGLNGGFGKVRLGKQENQLKEALTPIDPFGAAGIGSANNYLLGGGVNGKGTDQRQGNQVTWTSNNYGGFSGSLGYIFGEQPGDNSAKRGIGARVGYANGPLNAQFAYQNQNYNNLTTLNADDKIIILGATYDFGVVKLHGIYGDRKLDAGLLDTDSVKVRSGLIGVTIPFGASAVRAEYIKNSVKDIDDVDSDVWALSYTYTLSKRTTLYATYVRTGNDDGSDLGIGGAGQAELGENGSGVAIGINHKF